MGTEKARETNRPKSAVGLAGPLPIASSPEERPFLLLVKPAQELLEPGIGLDLLDRVKRVAQFVMRPGLVDEILAGMAGRSDVPPAFAARHYVVPACRHLSLTKCANFGHKTGQIFLEKHIHSCRWLKVFEPLAECRGLAPLARRHALVSTEARLACPVGIPEMVRVAGFAPATFPS